MQLETFKPHDAAKNSAQAEGKDAEDTWEGDTTASQGAGEKSPRAAEEAASRMFLQPTRTLRTTMKKQHKPGAG